MEVQLLNKQKFIFQYLFKSFFLSKRTFSKVTNKLCTGYIKFIYFTGQKYELPRPEEVAALKQKLEKCHSLDLLFNTNPKKRKGYEDDEYVTKKCKMNEEEWTDDDLVDSALLWRKTDSYHYRNYPLVSGVTACQTFLIMCHKVFMLLVLPLPVKPFTFLKEKFLVQKQFDVAAV